MADETPSIVNLDLNLGPLDNFNNHSESGSGSYPHVPINLEDWLDGPVTRLREAVRQRSRRLRSLLRQVPIPPETRNLALELIGRSGLQTGEGSVAAEERSAEAAKMCENGSGYFEGEDLRKKEDDEKYNSNGGSFFDCNICLDLAKDPVVTCCGHLFCWPCLYRWLHHHSDAKECPVCKGEVTLKTVTPIYGRANNKREPEVDSSLKIPLRPQARRIESWRQTIQRTAFTIPMEEMIRRLGSTFDLSRELVQIQSQNPNGHRESPERSNSLLNRILTSRGMRRERTPALPPVSVVDLTESSPTNPEVAQNHRFSSLLLSRSNAAILSNLTSSLNSDESLAAERSVESYFLNNALERIHELPPPVDDRDSVSSIAAVIHSGSQTIDNAVEIDSRVSLSTSSSRRRNDTSRISDVDSEDSRAPRRRRLN
ncbi:E3 ubiquitin ligase [Olea europaea subsp. europaea]|uniref:E3 ubiquitin-protein ligase RMA n=1 Tax=Olea europaea subsp. europaea TaxID=158383 RepID=A0A8S0T209_OLEEU|nr:E3 ubiquitin ligase [Olea europaea subsp. europaea]